MTGPPRLDDIALKLREAMRPLLCSCQSIHYQVRSFHRCADAVRRSGVPIVFGVLAIARTSLPVPPGVGSVRSGVGIDRAGLLLAVCCPSVPRVGTIVACFGGPVVCVRRAVPVLCCLVPVLNGDGRGRGRRLRRGHAWSIR